MEESGAEDLKTEIFHRALEILDPVARTRLVKQLCSDDLELRRGVEKLLQLDGDGTLIMETSDQVGRITPEELAADKSPPEAENYNVGEEIARGGMGSIREAEDTKLDRKVAVKVMHWDVQADPSSQARFLLEAKVLAHLAHPNIVPIHDIVWENGKPLFYSMKLVAGQSLQKILNDLHSGDSVAIDAYPLERLLSIFRKICDAIAFAHSRGIIHRDLKPENVMVGEFGEVLVMDWGLAKILSQTEDPVQPDTVEIDYSNQSIGATLEGSVMGTPQYMSPEQAAGEIGRMDYRSDIFSLGGILYTILTLRPPVDGENINEVLEKVRSGDVNPPTVYSSVKGSRAKPKGPSSQNNRELIVLPHVHHGHVPEALSAVAMKALSVKKRDRYQQVSGLSRDIEKWQNGFATSAEDAGLRKQLALLINRHKTLFTTATAAWAVITALAVWFVVNLQAKEKRAVAGEAAATQALARSSLSLAEAALRETDGATMRASLDQVPHEMRGPVWEYLDRQSHSSVRTIDGPQITCVTANPAVPEVFAYSDVNNVVRLANARTGEISLEFHTGFIPRTMTFSPDGKKLAMGTVEGAVNPAIYDGEDGRILMQLPVDKTTCLKFNQDGSLLLHVKKVAVNMAEVSLWNATSGQNLWSKNFNDAFLQQADFIPGGNLIFLGSGGQSFCISQDNGSIVTREVTMRLQAFAVSKNGRFVVCGTPDGVARYQLPELRRVYEIKKGNTRINKVVLSPDNSRFLVFWNRTDSSRDPGFEIRDSITGELRRSFPETEGVSAVMDMHPLSGEIFMGGSKRTVWEGESPLFLKIPTSFKRNGMFFGTDEWFLGPVGNREFALYQIQNGETKVINRFASKNTSRWTVTGSPSGDSAFLTALGGGQKPFRFLKNPGLNAEVLAPKPRPDFPSSIKSLDPRSGRLLASSGYRTEIRDAKTSETIIELQHRSDSVQGKYSVSDLAWIDSGNKVLGAGSKTVNGAEEYCLLVWDALTGEIVKSVALDNRLEILSVPTVGNRFAATGREKKIQIFDVESLGRTTEFRAHDAEIGALAWHPTLPVLASASADFTVKIWDLETQKCIQILRSLDSGPTGLSFSPGGRYLTCSDAQNIRVWELESVQNPVLNCDLTGNFVARLKDRQKLAHAVDGEPVSGEPVGDVRKDLFKTSMLLAEAALREHDGGLLNKALQAVPIFMRDRTWDYLKKQTNTSIRTIGGGPVPAVAANPQIPNVFAYSDSRNVIRMINVRTGTELLKFSGDFAVTVMVFSKDGKILALGNRNGETIAIHRASDGRRLIQWNSGQSIDIEFTHNGKSLLQLSRRAGVPPVVNLWNTETGELVWNTEVGGHFCKTINLIPGEERFLFGRNGELLVLSEADGSVVQKIKQPGVVTGSAVSKDGLFAITGTTGGHLTKKFLKGPQSGFVIRKPDASIREIHLSSDDGRFFVSWQSKSRKGVYSFEVRDSATGELRRSFTEPGRYFTSMDIHPLTDEIFTGGWQKMVWQGESPPYYKLPTSNSRTGVFPGTDEWFLGPDGQAGLALMQIGKGSLRVIRKFPGQRVPITGSDGKDGLLEGGQGVQLLRHVGSGGESVATVPEEKREHKFLKNKIFSSTRHIPGPRFDRVLATDGSMTVIRDAKTGRSMVDLEHEEKEGAGRFSVGELAWFDQGRKIIGTGNRLGANGKNQFRLLVWDADTGRITQTAAATTQLDTLVVSPDETRFASAGTDMTIRVHDTSTLQFLYGFRAHNAAISNLAWHPKQQVLASASEDLTVKIWDLRADKCVQILRTLDSRPTALSFSPGGKMITCSDENYVRVWALDTSP